MHDHTGKSFVGKEPELPRVLLVGNPNVGKSLIFSILTGKYVTVSNYPGTTVEITEGAGSIFGKKHIVIDTPGVNSLIPMSEDEKVARDIILNNQDAVIIQVADSKNLDRSLYISAQIAELERPFILLLNMSDEAKRRGITIDVEVLSRTLGVEVLQTVATRKKGFEKILGGQTNTSISRFRVDYPPEIENAAGEVSELLPPEVKGRRGIALMLLAGDETMVGWLNKKLPEKVIKDIDNIRSGVQKKFSLPLSYVINMSRLKNVHSLVSATYHSVYIDKKDIFEKAGEVAMHPLWGVPVLAAVLVGVYYFVGVLGAQVLVDFFESVIFGVYISPWCIKAFDIIVPVRHSHVIEEAVITSAYDVHPGQVITLSGSILLFIHDLLVGPYGVITMALSYSIAIVLPIVTTFFIAFGMLEDSGFLPRLAVMLNRIFRAFGLSGKAILPMVLGLGCDTMATITARILDTKKEKIIVTLLLALGVPCSAQLGVILGMLGGLSIAATFIWCGVIAGVIFMVGYLASLVIPGRSGDFILEIPPIRIPGAGNVFIKTIGRLEWYIKEAVPLFILGTLLLFFLDKSGALETIEKGAAPVVQGLLDLPREATGAFIVGFLRRDYGAAGLFSLAKEGLLTPNQILVSLVTITLFVPCVANLLIIVKERGWKTAGGIVLFIFPFAFFVGAIINIVLKYTDIRI